MNRVFALLVVFLLPASTFAQTKEIQDAIAARLAAAKFILALEDPAGGFRPLPPDPLKAQEIPPTLPATSAAARALKYLGAKLPNADKHAAFIMSCYDPATGGFGDVPTGKRSVYNTSVGVMAAVELGVPKEKFKKALTFIYENTMSFEDARIGAAAVEAWGVKDCPFPLDGWFKLIEVIASAGTPPAGEDPARMAGAMAAMMIRLGQDLKETKPILEIIEKGHRPDGGWGKLDAKTSDLESTYRVMRGYYMMKQKPKDLAKVREFIAKCRNADGGYGVAPGEKSAVGPTYFAAIVSHWLDGMEK